MPTARRWPRSATPPAAKSSPARTPQLAALARRHGGAAKPSGAGGGDLGVAFTIGNDATQRLREDARAAGLTLLSLGAPAPGLRLENA